MNETKQPGQNRQDGVTQTAFWGTITLAGIDVLICSYFFSVLSRQAGTPITYAAMAVFLLTIITAVTSIVLTLSRRQEPAVKLLFGIIFVIGFSAVTLFQDRAASASFPIVSIAVMVIQWLFPNHAPRKRYVAITFMAFALMWVIEWINPPWRIRLEAATLGPVAVIGFAVILVAVVVRQNWASLSLRWKMGGIVAILSIGLATVAYTGYSGLQSLQYQLSNIYDFMLVPIVAINNADSALADAQLKLANLDELDNAGASQNIADIQANNQSASDVIQQYDTEWVTTLSPEFTRALREADKLDLQQQELETLARLHTNFDAYLAAIDQYTQSIEAGQPDTGLAEQAGQSLQDSRDALQELIAVNNAYADFSNLAAQSAHRLAITSGAAALGLALLIGLFFSFVIVTSLTSRLSELTGFAVDAQHGKLDRHITLTGNDEITVLGSAFNEMTAKLRESFATLEQRVADRTRNLELAAEVGRSVSQVRELDIMLKDACELILKEFSLYYVQVYLSDPSHTNLILEAGTGDVGAQLVGRGHSLPLNTGSINGRAATEKHSVVISDTAQSATFRQNPLLPETRSEMAVPLIVADRVVGVLDMQSSQPGVLTQEVLPAFEALAGQLAVAVQNANLLAETKQARAQVEAQARRLVRQGWNEHLDAIHKPKQISFLFDHNKVIPLAAMDETQLPEEGKTILAPITVTSESLGSLEVEIDDEASREQTNELVNIVASQVAQQIENLRLLESAERYRYEAEQAARLQTIEGWQNYVSSRSAGSLGYMYDTKEVRPHCDSEGKETFKFALPLKAREEMIGQLAVQGLPSEDQTSFELANAVAERLSAHIENLRLFEETKRGQLELNKRAQNLAAVSEISAASAKELDIQKLLETVVHLTQRKFGLYHAHVFTFNEGTHELQIAACGWKEGDEHEGTHGTTAIPLNQEQSLVARAARSQKAVIVNDVHNEPGWLPNPLLPYTKSEMAVPLIIGEQLLGVLDVQSDRFEAFSQEDASIYTALASQIATALQNARSFEQAQQQAERESMLNTIGQKIQSATSVEAVLQIAARELGRALGAPLTIAQLGMAASGPAKMGHNGNGH